MAYRKQIACECGKVYPPHSRAVNASFVNGIANGCVECRPVRMERENIKALGRIRYKLAMHIAKRKKRIIHRDVAVRYLQRFGGHTFGVRKSFDMADIFLESESGIVLGMVTYSDKYPKPPAESDFADLPF